MRTLAFVERNQEYDRFVQKVVKADIIITYDISGLWLLLRNLYLLKRVETIVLVGLRTVDIELVKFLRFIRVECFVLQHAVNENRSAYQFKILVSNLPKIFKWSLWIVLIRLATLFVKKTNNFLCKFKLFYFTDYYLDRFQNLGIEFTGVHCPFPNPFVYGTVNPITKSSRTACAFYIDEPLFSTAGISLNSQLKALHNFCQKNHIDSIEVRLHPRSNAKKYEGVDFLNVVHDIPDYSQFLLGYQSNMLLGDFGYEKFYRLDLESLEFREDRLEKNSGSYIESVKISI